MVSARQRLCSTWGWELQRGITEGEIYAESAGARADGLANGAIAVRDGGAYAQLIADAITDAVTLPVELRDTMRLSIRPTWAHFGLIRCVRSALTDCVTFVLGALAPGRSDFSGTYKGKFSSMS